MQLEEKLKSLDEDIRKDIVDAANFMFLTYIRSTDGDDNTTHEGLRKMEQIMEEVPLDFRGLTFEAFLTLLSANDIEYDPFLFQASPSKAVH